MSRIDFDSDNKYRELLERLDQLMKRLNDDRAETACLLEDIKGTLSEWRKEIDEKSGKISEISNSEQIALPEIAPSPIDSSEKPDIPTPSTAEEEPSINWFELPVAETLTNERKSETKPTAEKSGKIDNYRASEIGIKLIGTAGEKLNVSEREKFGLESFIGSNVFSKLGIFITLIGIFVGMKYAIDRDLIGPAVRLISGYVAGTVLAGTGLFLKKKYLNYSAVLLGGGLAVMYLITYLGYDRFEVIPQAPAFILMLAITGSAVFQASEYKQQAIAHIGLTGAYAIPFLVGNDTGQYLMFLSYVLLVNLGILYLSYRVYWKSLLYSAFVFTWLIYATWYFRKAGIEDAGIGILFAVAFFFVFYAAVLSYKLLKKEDFKPADSLLLIFNALIFYGFSRGLFLKSNVADNAVLITLFNSAIHFGVFALASNFKPADKTLYYISFGLGLLFAAIVIPMYLDGNWITLIWSLEALLLTSLACRKSDGAYFVMSFILIAVSVIGLIFNIAPDDYRATPVLNVSFLVNLLIIVAFGYIFHLCRNYVKKTDNISETANLFSRIINFILPVTMISAGYVIVSNEITIAFYDIYNAERELLCRYIFSFLYFFGLFYVDKYIFNSNVLKSFVTIVLSGCVILTLTRGLVLLGIFRDDSVFAGNLTTYFGYRYAVACCIGYAVYLISKSFRENRRASALLTMSYVAGFIWISNEYLSWMAIMDFGRQGRLGLSIVWACFSILLIVHGIASKNKFLRIAGISLIGVTVVKLFFYDLINADTLTKTVISVGLGILLLITAYLYNRYKHVISEENNADVSE